MKKIYSWRAAEIADRRYFPACYCSFCLDQQVDGAELACMVAAVGRKIAKGHRTRQSLTVSKSPSSLCSMACLQAGWSCPAVPRVLTG